MEKFPLSRQLINDESDDFFPDWITVPLTHMDKVLLTVRMKEGNKVSHQVLELLTPEGVDVYNSLFSIPELPDEILEQMILDVEDMKELMQLRSGDIRIRRLSNTPRIIKELFLKFNEGYEYETVPQSFEELLEWYEETFIDTPGCEKYNDIDVCVTNAIETDNFARFKKFNPEKVMDDEISVYELIRYGKYQWLEYLVDIATVNQYYDFLLTIDDIAVQHETIWERTDKDPALTQDFIVFMDKVTDRVVEPEIAEYLLTEDERLRRFLKRSATDIQYILSSMIMTKMLNSGYTKAANLENIFGWPIELFPDLVSYAIDMLKALDKQGIRGDRYELLKSRISRAMKWSIGIF